MGRIKRSTVPIEGIKHGVASGYDKGCGCLPCRRANRERTANYRDNKAVKETAAGERVTNEPPVSGSKMVHEPGTFEGKARRFVEDLAVEGAEADLLAAMLVMNAQLLDNIAVTGQRWHLSGSAQKTMMELKSQLRRLKDGGEQGGKPAPTGSAGDELAGLLGGLTQQG